MVAVARCPKEERIGETWRSLLRENVTTHIVTNRGGVVSNAILHRDKFDRKTDKAVRYNFGK